jgi:hypothetical protein
MKISTISTQKRPMKRAAALVAMSGALVVATAGIAEAAQSGDLAPQTGHSYATWFGGGTVVCVKNLSSTVNASFTWVSSTSSGGYGLRPSQELCQSRSYVGFRVYITNTSPDATLHVSLPYGP